MNGQRRRTLYIVLTIGIILLCVGLVFLLTR